MATNVSSLFFNGTSHRGGLDSRVTLKGMSAFTWMAWFIVGNTGDSGYKRMYVERQGTGSRIRFACTPYRWRGGGRLRFEFSPTDGVTDTNYDYNFTWDDRWHHAAFVGRIQGDNPSYETYLDGNLIGEGTLVRPSGVTAISNTNPMGGGAYLGNASFHTTGSPVYAADRYWNGFVDEIILFNEAKTGGDITEYYGSRDIWDMADTSMFSYYRLDENTGSTMDDADNPGWLGSINSTAMWSINRPFIGNGNSDTTVPTTPTLVATPTTLITADGFTADWNATTDNVWVQYYELQVASVSNFASYDIYETDHDTTIQQVTGLLPATNYYWRVRAFDAAGNASGYTTVQSLTTGGTGDVTPPLAPTNLTASQITHSSFRVNFTASVSSDETGYKLDVSTQPTFDTYLSEFRNRDIGNVAQFDIYGTLPLTTYYVRLRAYDAADNESFESTTLVVQTTDIPDTIPPLTIEMLPATSITSNAFTANWSEGIDNVGISHYLLDVATDDDFLVPLVHNHITWSNINAGDVTSYRLENLPSELTVRYRVRAVDPSGNVSPNPVETPTVTTLTQSVDEGGFISTVITPIADSWVNSGATTTNYGTATTLEVQGNGTINSRAAHLQVDLSQIAGTLESVMLRLYVRNATVDTVSVAVDNVTFDEVTITWANQPTVSGLDIDFAAMTVGEWVSIDVTSLILDGAAVYDFKVFSTGTDLCTFDSREGEFPPEIEVESDPSTATQVEPMFIFHDHDGQRINYIRNPSSEDGTTNFWTAIGSTPAVLTSTTIDFLNGLRSFNVVCGGTVANQGMRYATQEIVAAVGQWWTAGAAIKLVSGSGNLQLLVTEHDSGGAVLASSTLSFTASVQDWTYVTIERQFTSSTAAYVSMRIMTAASSASTFRVDTVILEGGRDERRGTVAYFDGDTSGAAWTGTARASTSRLSAAEFHADTTYVGDGNLNNGVIVEFKRADTLDWIRLDALQTALTLNRGTKRAESLIGPSYGIYNHIKNPSFELNASTWSILGGATIAQNLENFVYGDASGRVTSLAAVDSGVTSNRVIASAATVWTASAMVKAPVGQNVKLVIRALNVSGVLVNTSPSVVGVNALMGSDEWVRLTVTYTLPTNTALCEVGLLTENAVADSFYVDGVQLQRGSFDNPYLDGSRLDGLWFGATHNSYTGYILSPETVYDIAHIYSDPDGLLDASADLSVRFTSAHITAPIPDNVTTVGTLNLTAETHRIEFSLPYSGDDNDNMTVIVEYRRSDLSTWTIISSAIARDTKTIFGELPNLNIGTSYTLRFSVSDPDGVYGVNPTIASMTTLTDVDSPDVNSTIMFGGFVLMGREDGKIGVDSHNAFGLPDRRLQVEDLPLVDGSIELSNLWGRRPISMTGFIEGETRAELEDNKNALKRALAVKLQPLIIDTLSTHGRYYTATVESLAIAEVGGTNIRHLTWDAEFVCADPFAYDINLTQVPEFTALNNGTFIAMNGGDLRVDPYIKIRTNNTRATIVSIVNETTGERITPSGTILRGDSLIIDTTRLAVTKNGVEINYAGGFPRLAVGANTFRFYLTAAGITPSVLVELHWRQRYL